MLKREGNDQLSNPPRPALANMTPSTEFLVGVVLLVLTGIGLAKLYY